MEQMNVQLVRYSNVGKSISVAGLLTAIRYGSFNPPKIEPQNVEKVRPLPPIQRIVLDRWMLPHARGLYLNDNTRASFWSKLLGAVNGYSREAYEAHMGYWPTYYRGSDGVFHVPLDAKPGTSMTISYTTNGGRLEDRVDNRAARRKRR